MEPSTEYSQTQSDANDQNDNIVKKMSEMAATLQPQRKPEPLSVYELEKEYFQRELNPIPSEEELLEPTMLEDLKGSNEKITLTSHCQFKAPLKISEDWFRYMTINREYICFLTEEKNTLTIINLKNMSMKAEIKRKHEIHDFAWLKDESDKENSLLACSESNGCFAVWAIPHSEDKIEPALAMQSEFDSGSEEKSDQPESTNLGQRIVWKNRRTLATFAGKEISLWELGDGPSESAASGGPVDYPRPLHFKRQEFGSAVQCVQFSNNINILYACFADNTLRIINCDLLVVIKEFQPFQDDQLVSVLPFRNMKFPQDVSALEKNTKENNLKDIFLTASERKLLKVWDLSRWDGKNKVPYCVETLDLKTEEDAGESAEATKKPLLLVFDMSKSFLFAVNQNKSTQKIFVFQINKSFLTYSEKYNQIVKTERFFCSRNDLEFRAPILDADIINIRKSEHEVYFQYDFNVEHVLAASVINFSQPCEDDIDFSLSFFTPSNIHVCILPCTRVYPTSAEADIGPPLKKMKEKQAKKEPEVIAKVFTDVNKLEEELLARSKLNQVENSEEQQEQPPPPLKLEGKSSKAVEEELENLAKSREQADQSEAKESKSQPGGNAALELAEKVEPKSSSNQGAGSSGSTISSNTVNQAPAVVSQPDYLINYFSKKPFNSGPGGAMAAGKAGVFPASGSNNFELSKPYNPYPFQSSMVASQHQSSTMASGATLNSYNQSLERVLEKGSEPVQAKEQVKEDLRPGAQPKKEDNTPEKSIPVKDAGKRKKNPKQQAAYPSGPSNPVIISKPPAMVYENPQRLSENNDQQISAMIEKKVTEKLESLNQAEITSMVRNDMSVMIREAIGREFKSQFESSVTPCFEKYLKTMYEQVNKTYEKGYKFYQDKLNIEETKGTHIKESLKEAMGIFSQMANTLNDQALRNQKAFKKMEAILDDKRQNNDRAIAEQLEKIANAQAELQKQIAELNKNIQPLLHNLNRHASEQELGQVKSEDESDEPPKDSQPMINQQNLQQNPNPAHQIPTPQWVNAQKMMNQYMYNMNYPGGSMSGMNPNSFSSNFFMNQPAFKNVPTQQMLMFPYNMFGMGEAPMTPGSGTPSNNCMPQNPLLNLNPVPSQNTATSGTPSSTLQSSIKPQQEGFDFSQNMAANMTPPNLYMPYPYHQHQQHQQQYHAKKSKPKPSSSKKDQK